MSITDQDRIEVAADNCEVLRARLAKYEDADGRPLQQGLRYTNDGELAGCPCCGSLDVGGAHDTVNCYSCGLQITKPRPLQNAADAWNKRAALTAPAPGECVVVDGLRTAVLEAFTAYERFGTDCVFEGMPMIHASVLEELAEIAQQGKAVGDE